MVVNNPLIWPRPYFLGGGGIWGAPLDSHEIRNKLVLFSVEEI